MPIQGLDHFNLMAGAVELTRLRDFYCDVIGLVEGARPAVTVPGFWLYAAGHPVLHLAQSDESRHAAIPPTGTFDHIAFKCTGFEAMRRKLDAHRIAYRINEFPAAGARQIVLRDSSGNGVELNYSSAAERQPAED